MKELNNMNVEEVAMEATEEVVTTSKSGGFLKKVLVIGGIAGGIYLIRKGAKKAKTWNEERKAKKEAKKAAKEGTFHSEIFDEDVEVSEVEVSE